jgi:hypothetical protein
LDVRFPGPIAVACAAMLCLVPSVARAAGDDKRVCVYSAHHIATLGDFGRMVGRDIDCALVYNDASPDWAGWENPWFLHHPDPDLNWARWATAPGTARRLIITQNLFPSALNATDWRHAGARGDYAGHAAALARNLVAAGLGDAVIRLAHEANGTWYPDSIGSTDDEYALWVAFWRNTVLAMRSVPGAEFRFDWCVNAAWRPIALDKFYPGDDVVDIVGIDAYDSGVRAGLDRWSTVWGRTGGVRDVLAFATAHGKPLSVPEWGVGPADQDLAGGDDPAYVDGIAGVVRDNRVAYQSYFYNHQWAMQLAGGPASLDAYRRHFGAGGDAVAPAPAPTPALSAAVAPPAAPAAAPTRNPATPARKAKAKAKAKRKTKARARSKRHRVHRRSRHRRSARRSP